MAYDPDLAERIRELLATEPGVSEQAMFGGLAFLIDGNLAVAANRRGGILVRVDPAEIEALLAAGEAEAAVMGRRQMRGWLHVDRAHIGAKRQLAAWVGRGVSRARAVPPRPAQRQPTRPRS